MTYVKKKNDPNYKYPLHPSTRKNLTARTVDDCSGMTLSKSQTSIRLPEVIRLYIKKLGVAWLRDTLYHAVITEMKKNGDDHLIPKPVVYDKVSESVIEN